MKSEGFNIEIMDYVDGYSDGIADIETLQEAIELKQLLSELKELPIEKVSDDTDERMQHFLQLKNKTSKPVRKLNKWMPYITIAASIVLLLFIFIEGESFEAEYGQLQSNPDKLGFIYELNKESLNSNDINWLKAELSHENNPNIKVTIIDLLNSYESELDSEYFKNLREESVPSVQMALLNSLENRQYQGLDEELTAFSKRTGLDQAVRARAMNILSNQSK